MSKIIAVTIWGAVALLVCLVINVEMAIIAKYLIVGLALGYLWENLITSWIDRFECSAEIELEKIKKNKSKNK